MGVLTLLTDFGDRDAYVGVMKGVILGIAPQTTIVDLTHGIPSQNVAAGRFQLQTAYSYFPPGTVHVAIVDPGVGSARRPIALATQSAWFVGPDNGLLTGIQDPIQMAVHLDRPQYWRTAQPSTTFHGRDIFASVAAHLCTGVAITDLGRAIDPQTLIHLTLPLNDSADGQSMTGCIQSIDHFGNLISNLKFENTQVHAGEIQFHNVRLPLQSTYADAAIGNLVAIVGSHGFIEISINCGNAQQQLGCQIGDRITLYLS